MKKLIFSLFALSVALFACGESGNYEEKADAVEEVKMAKFDAEISVPTIQCSSCASTIKDGLNMVDGVKEVEVDTDKKMAFVNFDAAVTNLAALEQAIAAEGYDANETTRNMEAYGERESCCQIPADSGSDEK